MFGTTVHRYIFLFGICTLGGGMLLGEVPTSIAEIILFLNWLLEGNFKEKFRNLKGNTLFWVVSSLFLLHLTGLIYTDSFYTRDFKNALDDIRVKIPLQLLPLIFFSTKPLTKKELNALLYLFVTGIIISTFWCLFYSYRHKVSDPREISRFISHIRYGLLINMGICSLIYLAIKETKGAMRFLLFFVSAYLVFFMVKISLVTGIVLSVILAVLFVIYTLWKGTLIVRSISLFVFILLIVIGGIYLKKEWSSFSYVDPSVNNIAKVNSYSGRPYSTARNNNHTENGFYIAYNIQYDELDKMWPRVSNINMYQKDAKGNPLAGNLIRYMASKGLTKDSVGITKLSKEDIRNIENGATNYQYVNASAAKKRLHELFWEYEDYKEGKNPSGNTVLMRLEFWRTALHIIKNNFWIGVGTGDDWKAFEDAYKETNSLLTEEWRLKSHNQFLAIGVSFGILGWLVFALFLFYPIIKFRKKLHPLYFLYFVIAFVSYLTEDTLESQTGSTFIAYFNSLFLWLVSRNDSEDQKL